MRANEYQTRAMSTRLPSCENATYMLFGLMAEIGEIADKIADRITAGGCLEYRELNTREIEWGREHEDTASRGYGQRSPGNRRQSCGVYQIAYQQKSGKDCKIDGIIELNLTD